MVNARLRVLLLQMLITRSKCQVDRWLCLDKALCQWFTLGHKFSVLLDQTINSFNISLVIDARQLIFGLLRLMLNADVQFRALYFDKMNQFWTTSFYVLGFLLDSDLKLTALGFEMFMVDLNPNYSHEVKSVSLEMISDIPPQIAEQKFEGISCLNFLFELVIQN